MTFTERRPQASGHTQRRSIEGGGAHRLIARHLWRRLLPILPIIMLAWSSALVSAADMGASPRKAPPPPLPSWTGSYLGIDAGLQSTRTDLETLNVSAVGNLFAPVAFNPNGATKLPYDGTGGRIAGFVGYNWQMSPQWVVGLESDLGWSDNKTTIDGVAVPALLCCATASFSSNVRTTWDASIRGRIGYLVTPSTLLYLTGGAAWQRFEETSSCGAPFCAPAAPPALTFTPFSSTSAFTKAGWTLGGGTEVMLWPSWTLRAGYRYADLGHAGLSNSVVVTGGVNNGLTVITSTLDLKLRTHTAWLGIAYRIDQPTSAGYAAPVTKAIYKAPPPRLAAWTGAYLGIAGGLHSTRTRADTISTFVNGVPNDLTGFATTLPLNGSGVRVASYAGYNVQVAPTWLVGIEGDVGIAQHTATIAGFPFTAGFFTSGIAGDALAVKTKWDASVRGRAGVLVTPSTLLYLTGGAAWLHYDVTSDCPGLCQVPLTLLAPITIAASTTKLGWTVGGGFEWSLWDRWLARAEYRYADFGAEAFTLARTGPGLVASAVDNFEVKVRTHTASVGLAYKFGD